MNDQLKSLTKLFSDTIFRIPDFQRGYAWGQKEIEEFWSDLVRLKKDRNHYVGVLTLESVKTDKYSTWIDDVWLIKSKNYQPYYIVDGQQRLTTSIILISAIVETMRQKNIEKLNYTTREKIIEKFLFEEKDSTSNKTFLFCYEKDNPSYSFLIKNIFSQPAVVLWGENTIYNNNLNFAKEFFLQKLGTLDVEQLENIYTKITQQFLFNTYEMSEDIDVYVSFETMNNRGKRLSMLELLKNRLIYISSLFNDNPNEVARLREQINTCWKNIYHSLGRNKDNTLNDDEFLDAHYHIYFSKKLFEMYKKENERPYSYSYREQDSVSFLLKYYFIPERIEKSELNITDVFKYIEDLNKCIEVWTNINEPNYSKFDEEQKQYLSKILFLINIRHNPYAEFYRTSYTKLLLCSIFIKERNTKSIKTTLRLIEQEKFIRIFYPYEVFYSEKEQLSYRDMFFKYIGGEATFDDIINKIENYINKILDNKTSMLRLIRFYCKSGFYNKYATPYILWEYEKYLQEQSKNGKPKIGDFKTLNEIYNSIEHIYPKSPKSNYWTTRFNYGRKNTRFRNSLGNLLMINQIKNDKLANKPFPEKCCNSQNKVGYKYGCYSEMEVAEFSEWTGKEIYERGKKLLNFIKNRWGIKLEKKDFKAILGLDDIEF